MTALGVGLVLHPNARYIELIRHLAPQVDFLEVVPETFWRERESGELDWSPWADELERLRDQWDLPLVAHGLGFSPGTAGGAEHDRRWLAQLGRDCARFGYPWYTEHLGWSSFAGRELFLPLPLPPTEEAVRKVADRLGMIRPFVPVVGFENQVGYFNALEGEREPVLWNRICAAGDLVMLLDLHNAWTQCVNFDMDLDRYVDAIDLARVVEVHLSGGADSEPGWLVTGRTMRLDSHDGPVPEPVWDAFARLRPRLPALRGVVVERLDDGFGPDDARLLGEELERARRIFER